MAAKPLPDQALLLKLLRYEPETGKLFWRERTPEMFRGRGRRRDANCRVWNERYAGKEASPCEDPKGAHGYRQLPVFKRKYLAHRVIWKMVTGEEPPEIDHGNGDKADNRWHNLDASDHQKNSLNLALHSRNSSGHTGVFWHKAAGKWLADITCGGVRHNLGLFIDKDAAIIARKAAERRLGFHPNHGRTAKRKEAK